MTTQLDLLQRDWCEDGLREVVCLTLPGDVFCADQLHEWLPRPAHDGWWGILMAKLRRSPSFRKVGYRPSARPAANGRVVAVWRRV